MKKFKNLIKNGGVFALAMLFLTGCCIAEKKANLDADHTLCEFPVQAGETDDAPRIQRAIQATPNGVLTIPRGTYRIATPIIINNNCSLEMNRNAIFKAVAPMDVVLTIQDRKKPKGDCGGFMRGGTIDGNGLASCLRIRNIYPRYTTSDVVLLNGKSYGLRVDGGCQIVCNNFYAQCTMSGLAGNTAFIINGGDSYYTDCHAVDYTVGFDVWSGGSNRLTRCHSWGGPIPPVKPGEFPEMLKDSVNFRIRKAGSATILRDCYADTGLIGYEIHGAETRLLGCNYFSNTKFKLDNITIIKHTDGRLLVSDGSFVKSAEHMTIYDGCGTVEWRNMFYWGWKPEDNCPGALKFNQQNNAEQPTLNLAQ